MNDEPKREDPPFAIFVLHYDGTPGVDVTHAVMTAYDVAVNSLDFGSGFLSTEEVADLRVLGAAIGASELKEP